MTTDTKQTKNILIIEDDSFLQSMLGTKFLAAGYEILTANDGNKGIETAQAQHPTVILLDLLLPSISGFDVLKALQADVTTRDIPVIVLSNLAREEEIAKATELGARKFLIKATTSPSEITEIIDSLI